MSLSAQRVDLIALWHTAEGLSKPGPHNAARHERSETVMRPVRKRIARIPKLGALHGRFAQELRRVAELFLDAQQLVVLGNTVSAAARTRLDLAGK